MKNRIQSGFTLAELLVVVAIVGALVAVSIPIFTGQLEKSREATDAANIRSQYSQVVTLAITDPSSTISGKDKYGAISLKQRRDNWQNTGIKQNLEGNYSEIYGSPKAGGAAWVEYVNEKVILHYDDGSIDKDTVKQTMAEKAVAYPAENEYLERGKVYSYKTSDGSTKYYVWRAEESKRVTGQYLNPENRSNHELVEIDVNHVINVKENSEISGLKGQITSGTVIYVISENKYKVWCDSSDSTISADNKKLITLLVKLAFPYQAT